MPPKVSIVILSYKSPSIIDICLRTLAITEGADYEVVVVDNGSGPETVASLEQHKSESRIDTLVLNGENHFFSKGNNIGFRHTNPESEFVLLLNSDVAFLRSDWLEKLVGWAEGTTEYRPTVWGTNPATPDPGPRDLVSCGWSHDAAVEPGHIRPEGWCCLIRRPHWVDLDEDFPFHYGFEHAISTSIRNGAKCGVLFNYGQFLVHREGGSGKAKDGTILNVGTPDIPGWFEGLRVESLDFRLGDDEHASYLEWS